MSHFGQLSMCMTLLFIFSGLIEEYDKEAKKLGEFLEAISDWFEVPSNQNQFENSF